jgi:deoxyribose-phosphate aldolase
VEQLALTQGELEKVVETIAREAARRLGQTVKSSQDPAGDLFARAGHSDCACSEDQPAEVRALAGLFDHTLLRPQATRPEIEQLAEQAHRWSFATVCVNSAWIPVAAERLRGSGVRVASVAGFPLGAALTSIKRAEAERAILAGAQEIDMVMNVGALKSGDLARAEGDIRGVAEVCHASGVLVKVILENAYLSDEEKVTACRIAQNAGADFVKTSTGFGPSGAREEDVRLMRATVGPAMGVKAAGGIRNLNDALRMLQAGATRLGSSASVAILEEAARSLKAQG